MLRQMLILVALLSAGTVAVPQEPGTTTEADDLTTGARMVLGADEDADYQWTLVGADEHAAERAEEHPRLNPPSRVWHAPLAQGRSAFKFEFPRDYVTENTTFHLYLDADADETTGRQDSHEGTDFMFTVSSGGQAGLRVFNPDGSATSASPRIVLEGNLLYLSADMPLKQEDGASVFECWTTSWVRDGEGGTEAGSRMSRMQAVSQPEPDIVADEFRRVAIIDTTDLEMDRVNAQVLHPTWDGGPLRARITWRANWITPGTVEFGLTEELGRSAEMPFSSRNHRVVLTDLQPDATYHFRVRGMTPEGEPMYSEMATFSTAAPQLAAPTVERSTAPLRVINRAEMPLSAWPVRAGVPFTRGDIFSTDQIRLLGPDGTAQPAAWSVLSWWPDDSIRWALVEFRADAPAALTEYAVEYGSAVAHRADDSPLRVDESDERISVDTGRLRFEVTRDPFVAFANVQVRGGDGMWSALEAGEMTLLAEDTEGISYDGATGVRDLTLEHSTSESAIIRAEGDHVAADGSTLLHWEVRIQAYADSPFVRVFHTFGVNDLDEEFTEFRRIAVAWDSPAGAGAPVALGGDEIHEFAVPADGSTRLFQHIDDEYTLELPGGEQEGRRAAGWVSAGEGEATMTVAMRDFWEHYPKSIQVAPGVVEMDIAPVLEPDQYDAFPELEHVLFAPFRGGVYRFIQGLQKRHEMLVQFGPRDDTALVAFRNPAVVAAPPERFRDTEALGRMAIAEDLPPELADYTEAVREALDAYIAEREEERLYGFMHFGDWFGERQYNWGNMEYDTPHGFLMQFASSGDPEFFAQGEHAARHYMDVDVVHHADDPRHVGLVWVHAMLHTGGYYERGEWEPAYPVASNRNWGHMWGEGLADYYWLSGDRRARESLLKIADMAASEYLEERGHVNPGTGWIIARHPGWMSKILIAGYAVSGDEYYLNAAKTHLDYWADFQTENGGWDRRLGGGHCACDPPHIGEAGFMVCVLMSAMKRYHELTGDEKIGESIIKGSRWLIEDLWVPEDRGFRYTSCPTKTSGGGAMHMIEPVTYAHRLQPDAIFRDVALQRAERQLMNVSASGKGISAHINTIPQTLGDLVEMLGRDYYALSGPGPHTLMLQEAEDRDFEVVVEAWNEGGGQVAGEVTLTGPDGEVLTQESISGTGRVEAVLEVPADERAGIHHLVLEPASPDVAWEVRNSLYREVVQLDEGTFVGGGIAYPRYRVYVWPETERFTLMVRSSEAGEREVTILDPNGHEHVTHRWTEDGGGDWQRIVIEPPPFEPITVGFGYRGALNESDRQWSVVGDGAPIGIATEDAGSVISASYLTHFVPERPQAFIGGTTLLVPGDAPTVRLDGTASRALSGRITSYAWDLGDGTMLTGPTVEHTYRQDGQFEVELTVSDDQERTDTARLTINVPPPELARAGEDDLILINASEFTAQDGGEVMVVSDRVGARGAIVTGWEGNPGHTLTWEAEVQEPGEYALGLKFASSRQGTTRDFFVNGEQPYPEMTGVSFPFTGGWSRTEDNWRYAILRDSQGEPLVFDLPAGVHTIAGADRSGGLAVDLLMLVRIDTGP
ncbi:MAG: PKD domain-containing protein [Armatimonadota bacterium]